MKRVVLAAVAATFITSAASADPVVLSGTQMDGVSGGIDLGSYVEQVLSSVDDLVESVTDLPVPTGEIICDLRDVIHVVGLPEGAVLRPNGGDRTRVNVAVINQTAGP